MDPIPTTQTLTLLDGRKLAYTTHGSPSSSPPIFYCHGWPSSHVETSLWLPFLQNTNAYIITIDRPGIGSSTFQPSRQILDFPHDIIAMADHLSAKRFKVLGVSAGCPYALACAAQIPSDRLLNVAVVSGFYGIERESANMLWSQKIQFFLLGWVPRLVEMGMDFYFSRPALHSPELFRRRTLSTMAVPSEEDKICLKDERVSDVMVKSFCESLREGSRGAVCEGRLLAGRWGFELKAIEGGERVVLWQGGGDLNCPVGTVRNAVEMIRGAELRVLDGEGHLSLVVRKGGEILKELVGGE